MYKIYANDTLIMDTRSIDRVPVIDAKLDLELNKTGTLTFTIPPSHPAYGNLPKLKTIITVYQDGDLIYRGRVLNDESDFYNMKTITCEGELAFMLDSVQRPYTFTGTIRQYLVMLIEGVPGHTGHNGQVETGKQFIVGNVTVTDGDATNDENIITRSDSDYKSTWTLINDKLIKSFGGYLSVRHENGVNHLDYLANFDEIDYTQRIEIGKNLLDIKKATKGEDIATAIIPVGGEAEDGQNLTISSLPDDEVGQIDFDGEQATIYKSGDFVYCDKAVERYGWIYKQETWDDTVKNVQHLQTVAVQKLVSMIQLTSSVELTSADLAGIANVNPFRLSRRVKVKSTMHGLHDETFLIEKLSLNLLKPADNKLTVGKTFLTFTETTAGQADLSKRVGIAEQNIAGRITQGQLDANTEELREENTASINQSSTEILSQISRDYYSKDDAAMLIESVNTKFAQTNDEFEIRFSEFQTDADNVQRETYAKFGEIGKHIRIVDGNVLLGENGNELTLKIQNGRISFFQSGLEVAYFSNRKLHVVDGEYTGCLQLGNYAFIPRASGNLSFKKVI